MKNIVYFFALCMVALGCSEIVELEKIVTDTVFIEKEKFIDRTFVTTDTVNIETIIEVPVISPTRNGVDSVIVMDTVWIETVVYVPRVDSIFVTTIVNNYDTIAVTQIVHSDTLFVFPARSVYSIPRELEPQVEQFYTDAVKYGQNPSYFMLLITVQDINDDVLQAYSFWTYGNLNIVINANLPIDQMFLPLYRELARWELKKQYSAEPESLLYPFFRTDVIRWSNRGSHEAEIRTIFQ